MENTRKIQRSELWGQIYNIVNKIPIKHVDGDAMDASSASTELEYLFSKTLKENLDNNQATITEYSYWEIHYVSCEGNNRWTIARAPEDWEAYQVRERIPMGGCGDDVAEVTDVFSSFNEDYCWDFSD